MLGLLCCSLQVFEPLLPRLSSVCPIWLSLALETKLCFLDCLILLSIYWLQTASIMKFQICRDIFHSYNTKLHLQQLVFKTRISLGPERCANFVRDRLVTFLLSQRFIKYSLAIQQLPFCGVSYHCSSEVRSVRDCLLNKNPWTPCKLSGACTFLSLLPCNLSAHIIRLPNITNLNTHT